MRCPACGHNNDPGARFCAECGTELTVACPTCGTVSAVGVKFCNNCGSDLRATSPAADDPMARLVPPELLAKLRSAQAGQSMQGERRTVTMLFADVQGSTAAAEQLDPEDWAEVINGAFEHLITPVYRYEGTLARLMGDAILAFFGAPIAHEDDPTRAVRAGLEIISGVEAYCTRVRERYGIPIEVRVGINTGLVVVGEVGSDLRVEYTALGDAINVAARMEQTALPGTVQVTEHTLSLTHGAFEAEDLGSIELRGKSEPVRAYRAVRFIGAQADHRATDIVGRTDELAVLEDLQGRVLDGRGWIASIVGEAGLGKSALLGEWERRIGVATTPARRFDEAGDIAWLYGASQSYDTSTPFAGIREVLRPWFGIGGEDDYERIRRATADVGFGDAAAFIAYVTGAELPADARSFIEALDPPVLRARSSEAIKSYLEAESARRPVVVLFEDLHWADDLSVDIVADLLDLADRAPVGLVIVMRPYREDPPWRIHERAERDHHHRYHAIRVEPMSVEVSAALLDELLDATSIDDDTRTSVLTRSEGNPLFLEELAHSVARGGIEGVPSSLSGILTARLDRLDDHAHLVAQVSSVLGTEFLRADLAAMVEGGDLDDTVASLLRSGVLIESPVTTGGLRFRHALMQEAAYESILLRTRRRLHHTVAEHLEISRSDAIEDIARHLVAAEDHAAAFPYLVEAGQRATKAMSLADAIGRFRLALEHVTDEADPSLVQQAHVGLGEAYALLPDLSESAAAFQRLFEYGEQNERPTAQVAALNHLAFTTAAHGGDPATAETYLAEARRLAEEAGDERGLADYHMNACMVAAFNGDAVTAVRHDESTIELGGRLGDDRIRIEGLVRRAMNQAVILDLANAESSIDLALAAGREAGLERPIAELEILGRGFLLTAQGRFGEAVANIEAYLPSLERYGSFDTAMSYRLLGFLQYQIGDIEGAIASLAASRRFAQQTGQPFVDGTAAAGLAAIYATIGHTDEIDDLRQSALAMSKGPLPDLYASTAWADLGTAHLLMGDPNAAEESFSRGLAASSLTQYLERTRLLAGMAMSLVAQDDLDRADTLLTEARDFAASKSFRASDALLDYVEGEIHRSAGRPAAAMTALANAVGTARARGQRLQTAAAARSLAVVAEDGAPHTELADRTIDEIGRTIIDEGLRTSFLRRWSEPVVLASV